MNSQRETAWFDTFDPRWLTPTVIIWLTVEFFMFGPYSFVQSHDNADVFLPALNARSMEFLQPMLWWPTGGGVGTDRLAGGYFAGIDSLLFAIFPDWLAYQCIVVSQIVLAVYFMVRLGRERLGLNTISGVFAGTILALPATEGVIYLGAIAYFPFVIWALDRAMESPSQRRRLAIIVPLGVFYGGITHAQFLIPFPAVAVPLWLVLVEKRRLSGSLAVFALFYLVALLMRSQDIVAMVSNADWSHRRLLTDAFYLKEFGDAPWLPRIAALTAVPALFLGWALSFRDNALLGRTVLALVVVLALSLSYIPARDILLSLVPFAAKFNFSRMVYFAAPFFALAAGLGLQSILRQAGLEKTMKVLRWSPSRAMVVASLAFLPLVMESVYAKADHLQDWLRNGSMVRNFHSPALRAFRDERKSEAPFRSASFRLSPAHLHAYGLETVDGYETIYSNRYKDLWAEVIRGYGRSHVTKYQNFKNWGGKFLLINDEHQPTIDFPLNYDLELLSLLNMRFVISRDRLVGPGLVPLRQVDVAWNERDTKSKILSNLRANFMGLEDFFIYENKNAFPRFFMVDSVRRFDSGGEVVAAMAKASLSDLRTVAFVEKSALEPSIEKRLGFDRAEVRVVGYDTDRIRLSVKSDGHGLLIVSNPVNPNWRLRVNGAATKILTVDHAFWGVPIAPGQHDIEFSYELYTLPHFALWQVLAGTSSGRTGD